METITSHLYFLWALPVLAALIGYKYVLRFTLGVVIVPEDRIGIVNKKFVLFGANKTLPDGAIVALKGEAGIQVDPLPPGLHFGFWPWQYEVDLVGFTTVGAGRVGTVTARDGKPIDARSGRVLARTVACDSFQDARAFLSGGGQRGPQMAVIPPGTYRINTALFTVSESDALTVDDNMVGVVTTKDGTMLPAGEIAGKEVRGHNMFQDGETFIESGGYRGPQEQVLLAGRYYINPMFATVEIKPMTNVTIAHCGVVISFVGEAGQDVTGHDFKHGNMVQKGQKGVWVEPFDPGKYPVNPYTHKLAEVSTANIVLNWATGKTEAHNLDKNLSTIKVRSADGFALSLDVSQIIHIPRNDAPKVIARFGSVDGLVTQVLEPLISNYFRNAAQSSDAIDFLRNRETIQRQAREAIRTALGEYNVNGVDTLIGDIVPPPELMKTLTDRKIAEQEKITFETQRLAAVQQKELEQAAALAKTQARVVDAEREVQIAEFKAQAAIKKADGDARSKTINATADAEVLRLVGDAEGKKITAVGEAEAAVIEKKTAAIGASNFALIETARAISQSGQALVPQILVGSGGKDGESGNGLVELLLAQAVRSGQLSGTAPSTSGKPASGKPTESLPLPPAPSAKPEAGNGRTA